MYFAYIALFFAYIARENDEDGIWTYTCNGLATHHVNLDTYPVCGYFTNYTEGNLRQSQEYHPLVFNSKSEGSGKKTVAFLMPDDVS